MTTITPVPREQVPPPAPQRPPAPASRLRLRLRGRPVLRAKTRATLLAALAYAAYAVFLTWPLAVHAGGMLSGPPTFGDLAGTAAQVQYVVAHHIFPFAPATLHAVNAPQGMPLSWVDNWVSFPSWAVIYGLGYTVGAVAGSAIFLLASFVLSGLSMFWLTRRLFGHAGAAFLAGFAFAFFPFAVNQISAHAIYMDGFVLVAAVWRMLELAQRPTRRNALLAGAAAAFSMWWTPYFILIGGVAFAAMGLVVLATGRARGTLRRTIRLLALACAPIAALLGGLGGLAFLAGGAASGDLRTMGINELYTYSARVAEWLAPDRHNLIAGSLTRGYLDSHLHGSNFGESSLYLGLSVLALALAGTVWAARDLRTRAPRITTSGRPVAALSGAVLAVAAALLSLPPTVRVLGLPLVMPSGLIFEFTSTWRDYSRFVELIELGLCISMAFALARLVSRRRGPSAIAALAVVGLVLVLDLWARPPVRATPVSPPAAYVWLAHHPGGIVADYPLEPGDWPHYASLLWQNYDHHPVLNGYAAGTPDETLKLGVADLREPGTAGRLAALDVRYIVVHPGQPGTSAARLRRAGFKLRFAARAGSVWEVDAAPPRRRVDALENFTGAGGRPGAEFRWLDAPQGELGAVAPGCTSCRGEVDFWSTSNAVRRTLTVTDARTGAILLRRPVPAGAWVPVRVRGVQLRDGRARLLLSTDVAPTWPRTGLLGPGSVTVREPRLLLGDAR